MNIRISREGWAMSLVAETAKRSTCLRRQVGAVLLNSRGHVLATGYNGVAAGLPHCNAPKITTVESNHTPHFSTNIPKPEPIIEYPNACPGARAESGTNLDGCQAIHAEQNALLQCSDVYQIHTCFVSSSPCMTCTKLLLNTSCERIVFDEEYPHPEAGELWKKAGRFWVNIKDII